MKFRFLTIFILVAVGVFVLINTNVNIAKTENQYQEYLSNARKSAEEGVPYVSCQNYSAALEINSSDENVYREYIAQTKLLDEYKYRDILEKYLVLFPNSSRAYEDVCTYYYDTKDYSGVISLCLEALDKELDTEKIKNFYLDCAYRYNYIRTSLDEAQSFLGDTALIKDSKGYGYIDVNGQYVIAPTYEQAMPFLGNVTAVCDSEKGWHFINKQGYMIKKLDKKVDLVSFENNEKILIKVNNKYDYITKDLVIPSELEYDYATNFKNGVAAVKKGNKWALINPNKEQITDYMFEDILTDEYNTCIGNGIIFAKYNGKYYMMDKNGSKIGDNAFDNAYPFLDNDCAAVCVGGKWGFADNTAKMVIEPKYESAKSFCNGLAPVKEKGKWSYINTEGMNRVEGDFEDCLPFTGVGITAVKENEKWSYIKLLSYIE